MAKLAVRDLTETHKARAERVAPVRELSRVSQRHKGAKEPVDRGERQIRCRRELAERDIAARIRDEFEQIEYAGNRLDGVGGNCGHEESLSRARGVPHRGKNLRNRLSHPRSMCTAPCSMRIAVCTPARASP